MAQARADALARILGDDSRRKLVVAGPGTGKTYTFQQLFGQSDGPNLALTFLTSLVADLEESLGDQADVYSFHGFAHRLLREMPVNGITQNVDYYPAFDEIGAQDARILGVVTTKEEVEEHLMNLRESSAAIATLIHAGDYYDVVGYNDSVYRVLKHLQDQPELTPTYAQIVVDEYQDFSLMEAKLIDVLGEVSPMLVVGDDDQALYMFRHASAIYLRDLVKDDRYTNFELPFCSRCTEVLVAATHRIVDEAQKLGLLGERIPKRYICYRPEKQASSDKYPRIAHARCSVERNNTPYIGKYLKEQISLISDEDISRSREEGYPTVLVIGPKQFSSRAFEYLAERFGDVDYKMSIQHEVRAIDGYRRLMKDADSRLGWRILLHVAQPDEWTRSVKTALDGGDELAGLIPEEFRARHLAIAELLTRIAAEEDMTPEEMSQATEATTLSLGDLLAQLGIETTPGSPEAATEEVPDYSHEPSILVTSLVGAKGLQASHVFVLGMNNGHFPQNNGEPTEAEVCQLLVALTRARESCTIVSVGNFGGQWLEDSIFTAWLEPFLADVTVNKNYFEAP
jgi:superfamily I DNA/RNA helicase